MSELARYKFQVDPNASSEFSEQYAQRFNSEFRTEADRKYWFDVFNENPKQAISHYTMLRERLPFDSDMEEFYRIEKEKGYPAAWDWSGKLKKADKYITDRSAYSAEFLNVDPAWDDRFSDAFNPEKLEMQTMISKRLAKRASETLRQYNIYREQEELAEEVAHPDTDYPLERKVKASEWLDKGKQLMADLRKYGLGYEEVRGSQGGQLPIKPYHLTMRFTGQAQRPQDWEAYASMGGALVGAMGGGYSALKNILWDQPLSDEPFDFYAPQKALEETTEDVMGLEITPKRHTFGPEKLTPFKPDTMEGDIRTSELFGQSAAPMYAPVYLAEQGLRAMGVPEKYAVPTAEVLPDVDPTGVTMGLWMAMPEEAQENTIKQMEDRLGTSPEDIQEKIDRLRGYRKQKAAEESFWEQY